MLSECSVFALQMENMRGMADVNIGEVAVAYQTIANDYEFKLRKKINDLWLYMTGTTTELK
jgi:hypothetical protein